MGSFFLSLLQPCCTCSCKIKNQRQCIFQFLKLALLNQTFQIGNRQQSTNRGIKGIYVVEGWKNGVQYILCNRCCNTLESWKCCSRELHFLQNHIKRQKDKRFSEEKVTQLDKSLSDRLSPILDKYLENKRTTWWRPSYRSCAAMALRLMNIAETCWHRSFVMMLPSMASRRTTSAIERGALSSFVWRSRSLGRATHCKTSIIKASIWMRWSTTVQMASLFMMHCETTVTEG